VIASSAVTRPPAASTVTALRLLALIHARAGAKAYRHKSGGKDIVVHSYAEAKDQLDAI
jgi:hypothetical protein